MGQLVLSYRHPDTNVGGGGNAERAVESQSREGGGACLCRGLPQGPGIRAGRVKDGLPWG